MGEGEEGAESARNDAFDAVLHCAVFRICMIISV